MQKKKQITQKTSAKNKPFDCLKAVCWIIIPIIVISLLVLDALEIYTFNDDRLMVLGIGLLIILLPFFSEITVNNLSVKRNNSKGSI